MALGAVATTLVLVDRGGVPSILDTSGCTAEVDGHTVEIDLEQAENAALITAVSIERGMPARAASIALATAFQESKLYNIDYGDRDSVGLFQQRTSQGWGTIAQLMDPVYATNAFYDALEKVDGYREMEITEAAQAVQRSAYPDAYADHEDDGRALASALTGNSPGTMWCDVPGDADEDSDDLDDAGPGRPRRGRAHRPRGPLRRAVARRLRARGRLDRPHGGLGALRGPRDRRLLPADQRREQPARLGDGDLPRRQRRSPRHQAR